jgi:hypothetical protein
MKAGFEIVAYPTVYIERRSASIPEAADAVRQNEVSLRGWNFPHTDKTNAGPFATGFQSSTNSKAFVSYVEGYRIYQSGLFVWHRAYWEDTENKKGDGGRPLLSLISAIWSFTEYLSFFSRLYERVAPDATVRIVITLRGCNGRELAAMDPTVPWFGGYISQEDVIRQEREVQVSELRASHLTIAAEMVKHVFHVFGWLDVTDEAITYWQQRLLKREF